ncbi:unnamed protein product [Linum tenue]|uniref:Uncharacterized protein n=1 Tax=Linum tenue TaxID=586396 RepID=A0AAV0PRK8_9ROSI|nr:unnamed protein product [Linum tenue]
MYLKPRSFKREGLLHQIHSSTLLQRNQTRTCGRMFRRSLISLTVERRKHCTNSWRNKKRRDRQLKPPKRIRTESSSFHPIHNRMIWCSCDMRCQN